MGGLLHPVDGGVAVIAAGLGAVVLTSVPDGIEHLLARLGPDGKRAEAVPLR